MQKINSVKCLLYWSRKATASSKFNGHRCPSFNAQSSKVFLSHSLQQFVISNYIFVPYVMQTALIGLLKLSLLINNIFVCRIAKALFVPLNFGNCKNMEHGKRQ